MSDPTEYFTVEVRDDHQGGSVWYCDDDIFDTEDEAIEWAKRLSMRRDNGVARVCKVISTPVRHFRGALERE